MPAARMVKTRLTARPRGTTFNRMGKNQGVALIAGATGYLGWYLTKKLCAEGWAVTAAPRGRLPRAPGDRAGREPV